MSDHQNGRERWVAVRTRARHEKIVARRLGGLGLTCLLPLRTETRDYAGATVHVSVPIVAGCVFVRGAATIELQSAMVPGVEGVTAIDPRTLVPLPPDVRATLLYGERQPGTAPPTRNETPPIWDTTG